MGRRGDTLQRGAGHGDVRQGIQRTASLQRAEGPNERREDIEQKWVFWKKEVKEKINT